MAREPYFPQAVFGGVPGDDDSVPKVIVAPHRYVQGRGVMDQLGRYMSSMSITHVLILISPGGEQRFGGRILQSLKQSGIRATVQLFGGECSYEAVDSVSSSAPAEVDAVLAVGGGKCLDAGKCIAFRLGVPVLSCPTIASTDAPCSAISVMYTEQGVNAGVEFFPNNPALVAVDTEVILAAPARHLVAGMGDALATWYEARTCANNPHARSIVGGRPTLSALAISELCAKTIYAEGLSALQAHTDQQMTDAFEQVVEANTLMSGVGFESGGLATAHAIATALTVVPVLHDEYLHGELVAIGTLCHLVHEGSDAEATRAAEFMTKVGLPVHLGQLSLDPDTDAALIAQAMHAAAESRLINNEPFAVTSETLLAALLAAHRIGQEIAAEMGDAGYRRLHS